MSIPSRKGRILILKRRLEYLQKRLQNPDIPKIKQGYSREEFFALNWAIEVLEGLVELRLVKVVSHGNK